MSGAKKIETWSHRCRKQHGKHVSLRHGWDCSSCGVVGPHGVVGRDSYAQALADVESRPRSPRSSDFLFAVLNDLAAPAIQLEEEVNRLRRALAEQQTAVALARTLLLGVDKLCRKPGRTVSKRALKIAIGFGEVPG